MPRYLLDPSFFAHLDEVMPGVTGTGQRAINKCEHIGPDLRKALEFSDHVGREGDVTDATVFRGAHDPERDSTLNANTGIRSVELEVFPAKRSGFAEPAACMEKEDDERSPIPGLRGGDEALAVVHAQKRVARQRRTKQGDGWNMREHSPLHGTGENLSERAQNVVRRFRRAAFFPQLRDESIDTRFRDVAEREMTELGEEMNAKRDSCRALGGRSILCGGVFDHPARDKIGKGREVSAQWISTTLFFKQKAIAKNSLVSFCPLLRLNWRPTTDATMAVSEVDPPVVAPIMSSDSGHIGMWVDESDGHAQTRGMLRDLTRGYGPCVQRGSA
jgi:hypothetical protein